MHNIRYNILYTGKFSLQYTITFYLYLHSHPGVDRICFSFQIPDSIYFRIIMYIYTPIYYIIYYIYTLYIL